MNKDQFAYLNEQIVYLQSLVKEAYELNQSNKSWKSWDQKAKQIIEEMGGK